MANGTIAGAHRGLQSGPGFDGVPALRQPRGGAARIEPAEAGASVASSAAGGMGRGLLYPAWLVTERELQFLARGGGVPERGLGAAGGGRGGGERVGTTGRKLFDRRISFAMVRLGPSAAFRSGTGAIARGEAFPRTPLAGG